MSNGLVSANDGVVTQPANLWIANGIDPSKSLAKSLGSK
jgi:hypothetical protein